MAYQKKRQIGPLKGVTSPCAIRKKSKGKEGEEEGTADEDRSNERREGNYRCTSKRKKGKNLNSPTQRREKRRNL